MDDYRGDNLKMKKKCGVKLCFNVVYYLNLEKKEFYFDFMIFNKCCDIICFYNFF